MKTTYLPISLLALAVLVVLMLFFPGRNKGETYSPAVGEIQLIGMMNEERAAHASVIPSKWKGAHHRWVWKR